MRTIVNRHGFSGGQETAELQRELGGDPDADLNFQYLRFFLDSDEELARIRKEYRSGKMLTGELKKVLIGVLCSKLVDFQSKRTDITDSMIEQFTTLRKLL